MHKNLFLEMGHLTDYTEKFTSGERCCKIMSPSTTISRTIQNNNIPMIDLVELLRNGFLKAVKINFYRWAARPHLLMPFAEASAQISPLLIVSRKPKQTIILCLQRFTRKTFDTHTTLLYYKTTDSFVSISRQLYLLVSKFCKLY